MDRAQIIDRWNSAIREIDDWKESARLERAEGTQLHNALTALAENGLVQAPEVGQREHTDWYRSILDHHFQIFVIEHDWAAAFSGAGETEPGQDVWDFRLPYPDCCFEFQFGRHRLCSLIRFDGEKYHWAAIIKTRSGWVFFPVKDPRHTAIKDKMFATIRAAAIALDAEVARAEIIRAPHKLNRARERRGRPLVADYHVIKLAQGRRSSRLPFSNEDENGTHGVRLHFRRGHWRHFENHKTWINWTLVGDPDLGFIDKHYRL